MLSKEAISKISKIIEKEVAGINSDLVAACENLLNYSPRMLPESCMCEEDGYEKGDEYAPFFSETYLYNLLGKSDARTILALMRPVWAAAGISREKQP